MKESVLSLKEKTTQHWFSYLQIACKYLKNCYDSPVKYNAWYIKLDQVQLSIYSKYGIISWVLLWLWSTDEYMFCFFTESPPLIANIYIVSRD